MKTAEYHFIGLIIAFISSVSNDLLLTQMNYDMHATIPIRTYPNASDFEGASRMPFIGDVILEQSYFNKFGAIQNGDVFRWGVTLRDTQGNGYNIRIKIFFSVEEQKQVDQNTAPTQSSAENAQYEKALQERINILNRGVCRGCSGRPNVRIERPRK